MAKQKIDFEKFDFRSLNEYSDSKTALEGTIIPVVESSFNGFCNQKENKKIIEFYEFYKEKIEELKYRTNIQYTLSIAKNRSAIGAFLLIYS